MGFQIEDRGLRFRLFVGVLLMIGTVPERIQGLECYGCTGTSADDMDCTIVDKCGADQVCGNQTTGSTTRRSCIPAAATTCVADGTCVTLSSDNALTTGTCLAGMMKDFKPSIPQLRQLPPISQLSNLTLPESTEQPDPKQPEPQQPEPQQPEPQLPKPQLPKPQLPDISMITGLLGTGIGGVSGSAKVCICSSNLCNIDVHPEIRKTRPTKTPATPPPNSQNPGTESNSNFPGSSSSKLTFSVRLSVLSLFTLLHTYYVNVIKY